MASTQQFDIIIIGGGITGAGIALDAASRGLKVLLLEKYDFASGTSSKSTKLIHGGLRYLKQLEFGLVSQVGRERAVIHSLAPHLVKPINMLLPVYKDGALGKYSTAMALWAYDFLANVNKEDKFTILNEEQTLAAEPLLKRNELLGAAQYKEYQTDDARLTIEVIKTAALYGAICLNYSPVEEFIYENENASKKIKGVLFHDLIQNEIYKAKTHKTINASGPWVDEVRIKDGSLGKKQLHLTKGVHIVVDKNKFPIKNAIYFDALDKQRMIFTIPRDETIYIGTTDTNYYENKEVIHVSKDDINYLLNSVNHMFPILKLEQGDIISSWAGLRPLIHVEGKSPSELSRKDDIFISATGLISIAGGKLTGYRKMGEKVVDLVLRDLKKMNDKIFLKSTTKHIKLDGADFGISIEEYIERQSGEALQIGLRPDDVKRLVNTYGTATETIIENAYEYARKIPEVKRRNLFAEILYCVNNEMITNISDFIIRRTGRLYFRRTELLNEYIMINEIICEILNLSKKEEEDHLLFFEQSLNSAVEFI